MLTEKNPRKQKQKVADSECDSLTLSSHTASLMATTLIKPVPGDSDLVIWEACGLPNISHISKLKSEKN